MSENRSSSLPAMQPNEPIQTTNTPIGNQDIKTADLTTTTTSNDHEKSSSPIVQDAHEESNQTPTSDANKINDNSCTPEVEAPTHDSTKTTTNPILDSSSNPVVTLPAISNHEKPTPFEAQSTTITKTSTTHDQVTTSPDDVQTTTTNQVIDSDPNKHATEISTNESSNVTPPIAQPTTVLETSTNELSNATPPSVQPTNVLETSTNETPSDLNKIPSATEIQTTTTNQVIDSDPNKHGTKISTNESSNVTPPNAQPTTVLETSTNELSNVTPPNVQPTTLLETSTNELSNATPPSVQPTTVLETSTNETPSDLNKIPSATEIQTTTTNQVIDSDPNKHATKISTNESSNVTPPNAQPTTVVETSTNETPSDLNKIPSATEIQTTTTNQVIDSDPNKHATEISTNESSNVTPPNAQPTTVVETSTNELSNVTPPNVQPTTVLETSTNETPSDLNTIPSATQIEPIPEVQSVETVQPSTNPDLDANKEATTISTTKDASANRDPNLVDQANPSKTDNGTKEATNKQTNKDTTTSETTSEQERKYLVNLIDQELKFIKKICPKLREHQVHITEEVNDASDLYTKLKKEKCDLKELKRLKKRVTKLKLQIPAKYRTYDDIDHKKNQRSEGENRGKIPAKLLKIMPRLHDKLFQESPFCKDVQRRYHDLGDEEFGRKLKLCLLCFSVFPENELISRRLMVYWWIAEGLTPREDDLDVGKTAEDYANGFFEKLMEKDFIEPATSKSPRRYVAICKMHPMVRAALVMIADQVKFFDFDEYGNPKDFGKFDEIESPEDLPNVYPLGDPREFFDFFDELRQPTLETVDFVDLYGNPVQFAARPPNKDFQDKEVVDRNGKTIDTNNKYYYYQKKVITTRSYKVCLMGSGLSKGITWEKLHMVFNVNDDILELKPEWFLRMKNVNVIFLGRWQSSAAHHIEVEEFKLEESLDNMNHVRFFSLQGVSRVSVLPNSISKLGSLVILDLRACHNLEVIPNTIGSLKCLTHLDMSECYLLKDIPKEISTLESLQVLKGFVVVDSPGGHVCTLQDLRKLENLRKLSMYTHMKNFPQEPHLDALQKFVTLRKLTILWGGHESKPQNDKSKEEVIKKNKNKISSRVMNLIPKKKRVGGSMRRMNAFNNSTLGSRLEKLDLKCFPHNVTPNWLTPGSLKGLKKLYIRGGQFSDLGQYQDTLEGDDLPIPPKETWNHVEVLRLKYLDELKLEWRELQDLFPKMTSLEKVKCPRLTLFPCNEHGVWIKKTTT